MSCILALIFSCYFCLFKWSVDKLHEEKTEISLSHCTWCLAQRRLLITPSPMSEWVPSLPGSAWPWLHSAQQTGHPFPELIARRGFRMTNVDVDKLESTFHPEICFAIYKGQRGSLANISQEPRIWTCYPGCYSGVASFPAIMVNWCPKLFWLSLMPICNLLKMS